MHERVEKRKFSTAWASSFWWYFSERSRSSVKDATVLIDEAASHANPPASVFFFARPSSWTTTCEN